MKTKRIVFLGGIGKPNVFGGELTKNKELLNRLKEMNYKISVIDTYESRGNIVQLICIITRLLYHVIFHCKALFLFSTSFGNTYAIYKLLKYYPIKLNLVNWVIGGNFANKVKDGTYQHKYLKQISWFLVEGTKMKDDLNLLGYKNVIVTPNFKSISDLPNLNKFNDNRIHFLFLSRIMPEKGCREILEAVKFLNKGGFKDKFEVDFYGTVDDSYKQEFNINVNDLDNVNYCGKINLQIMEGYEVLAQYHYMLFPTWWIGEGFPGVIIDAYKAGVPIIGSDWNLNIEYIDNGKTGIICHAKNVQELSEIMIQTINKQYDALEMAQNCQTKVWQFDTKSVVTNDLIEMISR